MSPTRGGFDRNVFVNCPSDSAYLELLRPLLFTVVALGYRPRLSVERSDSAENRLDKICEFIRTSKYSIHDLSRMRASRPGELARMNMPFELGIDYGTRLFGPEKMRGKRFLILERDLHTFRRALSDLSGVDIKPHHNRPTGAMRACRDWFVETVGSRRPPSPGTIWYRFTDFTFDFYRARAADGFTKKDLNIMPISEYISFIQDWVSEKGL